MTLKQQVFLHLIVKKLQQSASKQLSRLKSRFTGTGEYTSFFIFIGAGAYLP